MRIGQSIWSRDDFNLQNPKSLLLFPTSSKSFLKFDAKSLLKSHLDPTDQNDDDDEEYSGLPSSQQINSSKKLFFNPQFRHRIYEPHQYTLPDGTRKTIYYFQATKISVDETGPFWPMAFPIKHPTPLFLSSEKKKHSREYYIKILFQGQMDHQTYDNQPTLYTNIQIHVETYSSYL